MIKTNDLISTCERLIQADFYFKYDREKNCILFKSYPNREEDSGMLGYHYFGYETEYCFDLTEYNYTLEEFIGTVFDCYKERIKNAVAGRLSKVKEDLNTL